MGIGFNWFKGYEITPMPSGNYDFYRFEYLGGDSTSHSARNIIKVQELIKKYSGKIIPSINSGIIEYVSDNLCLIEPEEMVSICDEILAGTECDEIDMRDRFEWFKQLSEEGYYLSYDLD